MSRPDRRDSISMTSRSDTLRSAATARTSSAWCLPRRGVLVRRLVHALGLPLTTDAAVALYAALVCDTGRFQYETTTPSVFELACELVTFDVPVSRLSRQLFEEHRFAYLPFGAGPRACIGESVAWLEGVLLLATIGQRWRLRPAGAFPRIDLRITMRPEGPVLMEVRPL